MEENSEKALGVHRDRIDEIDERILSLMNERITAAESIAKIKSALDEPAFYRPEREAQVLRRLRDLNEGPLEDNGVEALFREIMSITRGSEAGLSVAVLGPEGTYTELAARQHFGSTMSIDLLSTIDEIFRSTQNGKTDFSVVPVENSTEGGVNATLDQLVKTDLTICGEINLKISHNLLGQNVQLTSIQTVYAHGQALAQCREWLNDHLPGVKLVAVSSNAQAAKWAADDPTAAAVAGAGAAKIYGLQTLAESIEDEANNTTRFLILSNRYTPPSGDDKTSLLLSCRNRPGALFSLLKPLFDRKIDMTKIESRPSRTGLWEYVFFIDVTGHIDDPEIAQGLEELKAEAGLFKCLGAYPVAR